MSFGPISVLDLRFNASKYSRIHPKGTSFGRLRVETQFRLDLEPKSYFSDSLLRKSVSNVNCNYRLSILEHIKAKPNATKSPQIKNRTAIFYFSN
jgi:hypothetical protein